VCFLGQTKCLFFFFFYLCFCRQRLKSIFFRNKTIVSEHAKTLMLGQGFRAHHKDHTAVHCPSNKNIAVDSCRETPLNPDYTRLGEDSSEDAMNITPSGGCEG
jgi:hypothetical protein